MFKKSKVLILMVLSMIIWVVGCSKDNTTSIKKDNFSVGLILTTGGVNDQSFNQNAWEGALKSKDLYDVDVTYFESHNESDYTTNIETAVDMELDLIIGVGFELSSAIENSAKLHPEQQFAIIDGDFETIPSNVACIKFDEEASGYLVGLIAGEMTRTNKIGFIGGMDIVSVSNFLKGYEKGAKEINSNIEVIHQYANTFTDAAKGRAISSQMYNNSVDIVFTAGGLVNNGVYEVAKENGKFVIAVDMAQSYIAPENIITSALKRVDVGVMTTIFEAREGKLKTGVVSEFNIENGGVDYEKTQLIPQRIIDIVENKK